MIIAIVQARMGSSRLPGKMLEIVGGKPLIDYVLERLCSVNKPHGILDSVVVATSIEKNNDKLVDHVSERWPDVQIIRGSEDDVLSRFLDVIETCKPSIVVRVTGDCPFVNLQAMAQMISALQSEGADIVNYLPGYEYVDKGLEVISTDAFLRAARDDRLDERDKEHVTSIFYRYPDDYSVLYIDSDPILKRGDIRLTVDTDKDLQFFERLLSDHKVDAATITLSELVRMLDDNPELVEINSKSGRKSTRHERARLGFRCDGGTAIGLGHVVGCLRMARLLADQKGIGAEFVVRENPAVISLIRKEGFAYEVIPSDTPPEQDINRLIEKSEESDWSGIIINFCKDDLERYTPLFHLIKNQNINLIFMDNPLPPSCNIADLLINALPHPDYNGYEPENLSRCYDGLEYFLVGGQRNCNKVRPVREEIERVLISMGGSDPQNLTGFVIKILAYEGFTGFVDVVVGSGCPHLKEIEGFMSDKKLFGTVSSNVSDLPDRIIKADMGFTSLGLTTYEMAYYGLPSCIIAGSELNGSVASMYARKYGCSFYMGIGLELKDDITPVSLLGSEFSYDQRRKMASSCCVIGEKIGEIPEMLEQLLNRNG